MAKINKTLLKNLIKECIVEVLAEGLGNSTTELNESIKTSNLKRNTNTKKVKNENFEKSIQKLTDSSIENIEKISSEKEKEIIQI